MKAHLLDDCGEKSKKEYMDDVIIPRLRLIASACGPQRIAFWALVKTFLADLLHAGHVVFKEWIQTYYLNEEFGYIENGGLGTAGLGRSTNQIERFNLLIKQYVRFVLSIVYSM